MVTKCLAIAVIAISLFILAFISFTYLSPMFSGTGGYVVTPADGTQQGQNGLGALKDAPAVSFWDLPAWVQLAGIIDGVLILIGMMGALPVIVGKIQNVLDNRNRLNIFNYVLSNPGCTQAEITEKQNMKNGTVKYHVQMLESEGKIILKRMGKFTRIFKNSASHNGVEATVLAYMKNDTSKHLLQAIMEDPGVTNQKLSEKFMLDKSSVHWHMERFLNDRLVRFEQDGKYKRYFLDSDVRKFLTGRET